MSEYNVMLFEWWINLSKTLFIEQISRLISFFDVVIHIHRVFLSPALIFHIGDNNPRDNFYQWILYFLSFFFSSSALQIDDHLRPNRKKVDFFLLLKFCTFIDQLGWDVYLSRTNFVCCYTSKESWFLLLCWNECHLQGFEHFVFFPIDLRSIRHLFVVQESHSSSEIFLLQVEIVILKKKRKSSKWIHHQTF